MVTFEQLLDTVIVTKEDGKYTARDSEYQCGEGWIYDEAIANYIKKHKFTTYQAYLFDGAYTFRPAIVRHYVQNRMARLYYRNGSIDAIFGKYIKKYIKPADANWQAAWEASDKE